MNRSSDITWHDTTTGDGSTFTEHATDVIIANTSRCCSDDVVLYFPWNNPHNLISLQTLQTIEKTVTCGLNPLLLAVGLPSNVINAVVFWRQGLTDGVNVSLFVLALVDFFCIFFWFLLGSFCMLHPALVVFDINTEWWKWIVRKHVRGFHRGFLFSSGCLTMLVAIERCLFVALPLQAASLLKTTTLTSFVVIIVTSLHLLCLVYPFKFDVVVTHDEMTGKEVVSLPHTRYYLAHKELLDVLENYIIMTVIPFVTFIVVSTATLITVIKLKRAIEWRRHSRSAAKNVSEVNLVKMLLIVSLIYIVTATPNIVLGVIRSLEPQLWLTGNYRNTFVATHLLYLFLGTVNSSVNFFVYYNRSTRFRQHANVIMPCLRHLPFHRHGAFNNSAKGLLNASQAITEGAEPQTHSAHTAALPTVSKGITSDPTPSPSSSPP